MKKTGPTALDRLFNVTVSDRDFWKMLVAQAEPMPTQCFDEQLCERDARREIVKKLTAWVHDSGFSGRQTKKMVEKAAKRVMKGYRQSMELYYREQLKHHEEVARTSKDWLERATSYNEAEKLRDRIKQGRFGKERHPQWPRGRR